MKKLYLSLTVILMAFMITACGMTSEEIDAALTQLDTTYQAGTYSQAQEEITTLEKSYKKMSDEQKSKFDTLKSSVEYAAKSEEAINYGLNNAQGFYDQKLYYEAQQELEKISNAYTLPPAQQKIYDEKKSATDTAIKDWKITEAFQKVKTAYNSGDYDTATSELSNIDTSTLSQTQNQTYQSWQGSIANAKAEKAAAKAKAEAEAKAKAGISASQAKRLAIADIDSLPSTTTVEATDCGTYYQIILQDHSDQNWREFACKVDKATGRVYDRVG